jgi:hypothetical protein
MLLIDRLTDDFGADHVQSAKPNPFQHPGIVFQNHQSPLDGFRSKTPLKTEVSGQSGDRPVVFKGNQLVIVKSGKQQSDSITAKIYRRIHYLFPTSASATL